MVRMHITLTENDRMLFDKGCEEEHLTRSSYLRLLIAEHENNVPYFIKYKGIINEISNVTTLIKALMLSNQLKDAEKIMLNEKLKELQKSIETAMPRDR